MIRTAPVVLLGVLFWLRPAAGQSLEGAHPEVEQDSVEILNLHAGIAATYERAHFAFSLHQAIKSTTPSVSPGFIRHVGYRWHIGRDLLSTNQALENQSRKPTYGKVERALSSSELDWRGRLALVLEAHAAYQWATSLETPDFRLKLDPMNLRWTFLFKLDGSGKKSRGVLTGPRTTAPE